MGSSPTEGDLLTDDCSLKLQINCRQAVIAHTLARTPGRRCSDILLIFVVKSLTMAYEKKIPVDLDCPLRLTMSLIDSKWKSCILDELRDGNGVRPNEIHKRLPEATPRVLDLQLKELVEDGLVGKTVYPELPLRSEYRITELGASLLPIIDAMLQWGEEHYDLFIRKYGR